MASDFTMVSGFDTGLTMSVPRFIAWLIGAHPVACAPWTLNFAASTRPSFVNSV